MLKQKDLNCPISSGHKEVMMKGIFVVLAAMSVCACASQPQKSTAMNPATEATRGTAVSVASTPSKRVYLDDYERVMIQAPLPNRQAIVLGANKERQ
jgi:hypothetical protein